MLLAIVIVEVYEFLYKKRIFNKKSISMLLDILFFGVLFKNMVFYSSSFILVGVSFPLIIDVVPTKTALIVSVKIDTFNVLASSETLW